MHTCATYEVTTINHVRKSTVYIFDILLNKYGYYIAYIFLCTATVVYI